MWGVQKGGCMSDNFASHRAWNDHASEIMEVLGLSRLEALVLMGAMQLGRAASSIEQQGARGEKILTYVEKEIESEEGWK